MASNIWFYKEIRLEDLLKSNVKDAFSKVVYLTFIVFRINKFTSVLTSVLN